MRLELTTPTLATWCSTTELRPQISMQSIYVVPNPCNPFFYKILGWTGPFLCGLGQSGAENVVATGCARRNRSTSVPASWGVSISMSSISQGVGEFADLTS